jgi:cytochrome b6-f complex iron-sulfur subunit
MSQQNNERRRFLTAGAATAGGLVLGTKSQAAEPTSTKVVTPPTELSLPLKTNPALAKIGGSAVTEVAGDKIIVAHVAAETFAACSAVCPHKGCDVEYEHETKHFVCPCHGARFSLDGKVLKGPAKKSLRSYATDTAALVSLVPKIVEKKVS